MKRTSAEFKTLLEVIRYCQDERKAFEYFRDRRWPNGVACPRCGCLNPHFIESRLIWRCTGCKRQFSVKVGTIFEDSPISLSKWLPAMWLIANCKNGISSYELHRGLGVTQKTAWFMLHRIRLAMQNGSFEKIGGHVEVDETYIGGKARNMHKFDRERKITGSGGKDKTIVMGFLERDGDVKTQIIAYTDTKSIHSYVKANVEKGSKLYTDELASYRGMEALYDHRVINHASEYVDGLVHTQGIESFWALVKRALHGTYISVEPFHLFRYLDEQAFRFNERKNDDRGRFEAVASQADGKRLTYKRLIGKELAAG